MKIIIERVKKFEIKFKKNLQCYSTLCSSMECAIHNVSGNTDKGRQQYP